MKLSAKQVNEIAQELIAGMKVYINRSDLEIRTILDWDNVYGDTEFWDEELKKIEKEWTDYLVLEKMRSSEVFRIMADFIEVVEDKRFQEDLIRILNRKSPFAYFKAVVESSAFRQTWFDFREKKYEEYVRENLESEEIV